MNVLTVDVSWKILATRSSPFHEFDFEGAMMELTVGAGSVVGETSAVAARGAAVSNDTVEGAIRNAAAAPPGAPASRATSVSARRIFRKYIADHRHRKRAQDDHDDVVEPRQTKEAVGRRTVGQRDRSSSRRNHSSATSRGARLSARARRSARPLSNWARPSRTNALASCIAAASPLCVAAASRPKASDIIALPATMRSLACRSRSVRRSGVSSGIAIIAGYNGEGGGAPPHTFDCWPSRPSSPPPWAEGCALVGRASPWLVGRVQASSLAL